MAWSLTITGHCFWVVFRCGRTVLHDRSFGVPSLRRFHAGTFSLHSKAPQEAQLQQLHGPLGLTGRERQSTATGTVLVRSPLNRVRRMHPHLIDSGRGAGRIAGRPGDARSFRVVSHSSRAGDGPLTPGLDQNRCRRSGSRSPPLSLLPLTSILSLSLLRGFATDGRWNWWTGTKTWARNWCRWWGSAGKAWTWKRATLDASSFETATAPPHKKSAPALIPSPVNVRNALFWQSVYIYIYFFFLIVQIVSYTDRRPCGVPTIRTDIAPPRIKRVSDHIVSYL